MAKPKAKAGGPTRGVIKAAMKAAPKAKAKAIAAKEFADVAAKLKKTKSKDQKKGQVGTGGKLMKLMDPKFLRKSSSYFGQRCSAAPFNCYGPVRKLWLERDSGTS